MKLEFQKNRVSGWAEESKHTSVKQWESHEEDDHSSPSSSVTIPDQPSHTGASPPTVTPCLLSKTERLST